MARKRRKRKYLKQRDFTTSNRLPDQRVLFRRKEFKRPSYYPDLREIQDLRKKYYEEFPKRLDGTFAEIYEDERRSDGYLNKSIAGYKVAFRDPDRVVVCKRRLKRRQELFRRRKVGKGAKVSKKRRWTDNSKVRC